MDAEKKNHTPMGGPMPRDPAADLRQRADHLGGRLPERRAATPPPEQGRRLATLPRPKEDAEIRITWAEYEGNPFVGVRVWRKGDDGQLWPDKHRGFSIRLRELPDVAAAIAEALDLAEEHLSRPQSTRDRPAARPSISPDAPKYPGPTPGRGGFDEFSGRGDDGPVWQS
jgi:hypothetical protein